MLFLASLEMTSTDAKSLLSQPPAIKIIEPLTEIKVNSLQLVSKLAFQPKQSLLSTYRTTYSPLLLVTRSTAFDVITVVIDDVVVSVGISTAKD